MLCPHISQETFNTYVMAVHLLRRYQQEYRVHVFLKIPEFGWKNLGSRLSRFGKEQVLLLKSHTVFPPVTGKK
jgi:hypothetical protein